MKTDRPDPNLPRGVQAFLFDAAERRRKAEDSVVRKLQEAGLREVILPVLDFADPYSGVTAEGDERVYRFLDRQGNTLSLRADFTPMAARVVAPRLGALSKPVSLFYRGDVVRDEETGVGRRREFAQVGAELYGDERPETDREMLALALSCLADVPAARLRLTLGWAGLLERLLASVAPALARGGGAGLAEATGAARARHVTQLETLLCQSGAAESAAAEVARALLVGFDPGSGLFRPPVLAGAAAELARAVALARAARPGLPVVVDLADMPQAPYYTGLTFSVDAASGGGTIAGGGRYDGLLARFRAAAPALGFCIGLEALGAATDAGEEDGTARPLRIAVGKGRLLPQALAALRAGGAAFDEPDGRRLLVAATDGAFELLLLKDDDVPTYVAHGGADLGIVGSDRVAESGEDVTSPVELPFGTCRLSLIGRAGEPFRPNGQPVRVGTKYRRLAARYFDERKIAHEIVPLAGSVELAAALKLTDVVVDLIESGSTIAANGLAEIETILPSRATLILGRAALVARRAEIAEFVERLRANVRAGTGEVMMKIVNARTREGRRELEALLKSRRGAAHDFSTLKQVLPVVEDVLRRGEPALRRWVERFDLPAAQHQGSKRTVSSKGREGQRRDGSTTAERQSERPYSLSKKICIDPRREKSPRVDRSFAAAFRVARRRIETYHRKQLLSSSSGFSFKDSLGVSFVEKSVPLDSVGVYVPGGRAFYPSSLLMGVVPARVAGVPRIVVATPPNAWASSPELRWAARELGVEEVLLAGGAHGIAGLVSVCGVAKIVGPGNRFVAAAKHIVSGLVAVDMPAGPSEVLIVASGDADPSLVAADLLAQAEHDPDATCLLVTDSRKLAAEVRASVSSQLRALDSVSLKGNAATARASLLRRGRIFTFKEISRALAFVTEFAAEHVQVMGRRSERLASSLLPTAGALFVGSSTPTALGDYLAGPNHVLPTGGAARSFSGLSVRDFLRWGRSVKAPANAARRLAPPAAALARFEGLAAHAAALDERAP